MATEKQAPEKIAADNASFVDDTKASAADSDSILVNSEGVTQHELATLRHVRDKIPSVLRSSSTSF